MVDEQGMTLTSVKGVKIEKIKSTVSGPCHFCGARDASKVADVNAYLCSPCSSGPLGNARLRYGGKALRAWVKSRKS